MWYTGPSFRIEAMISYRKAAQDLRKKRLLSFLLAAVVCLGMLSPGAAAADIYFVAVDDSIPLTLPSGAAPYYSGGVLYAPYTVFNASPGGVVPSYNASEQKLVLFRRGARLIFDLAAGTVTDEDKNVSERSTVSRGGMLYVPLEFCLSHFGLSYSMLTSASGYSVLRFTTGSEVYENTAFLERAENLISYLAEQYESGGAPSAPQQPEGGGEAPAEEEPHVSGAFSLAVTGAENMSAAAQALEDAGQRAAFFLTAEEIEAEPELVRSLYAAGHSIGVTCAGDAEDAAIALEEANNALSRVLHRKTLLALLTAAQSEFCPGYCIFVRPDSAPSLTSLLAETQEDEITLFLCGADMDEVLKTLEAAGAPLRLLRETSPLALILTIHEEADETESN